MGRLRSSAQLQEIFQKIRERKQREKEALQRKEEKQQKKVQKKQEKVDKRLEKYLYEQQRTLIIYHTKYIQRFLDDYATYDTIEELKEAENRGEGAIRWDVWNKLVDETRKQLE